MGNLWRAAQDWWVWVGIIAGALLSSYDVVSQLRSTQYFRPDVLLAIGLILFLACTIIAVFKAQKDKRKRQQSTQVAVATGQHSGLANGSGNVFYAPNSPVVTADGHGKIAGRDIIETHNYYDREKDGTETQKPVDLAIEVQEKLVDQNPYIIIVVKNNEKRRVHCRCEIHELCDESNRNILREISQFANHFSWSGDGASKDVLKPIEAGLDATVNIATIRRAMSVGFNWLFREDPNKNWNVSGVYKLKLGLRGNIDGVDFAGDNLRLELEYREKMKSNGAGGWWNEGQLMLLKWDIDRSDRMWWVTTG